MIVDFELMPANSRIWIYQSDRVLSEVEQTGISRMLRQFLKDWTAHGVNLKASFQIRYDHFIIIALDETASLPSGCSIDKLIQIIQYLGQEFKVDFFNREMLAFYENEKVELVSLTKLKEGSRDALLPYDSLYFNNLIQKVEDLDKKWLIKASESWLNRYLEKSLN